MAHYVLGALNTILLLTALNVGTNRQWLYVHLGGIWAMLPDIHWLVPIYSTELKSFHASVWANLFWFHRWADRLDTRDSWKVTSVLLVVLTIAIVYLESRNRHDGPDDS